MTLRDVFFIQKYILCFSYTGKIRFNASLHSFLHSRAQNTMMNNIHYVFIKPKQVEHTTFTVIIYESRI
jgi:hypothetical protein